jgi:hypothetical protein
MHTLAWRSLGFGLLGAIVLSACGTQPSTSVQKKSDPPPVDSSAAQTLQKHIREEDKRIAEIESQLAALKMIDQDLEIWRKPARRPATLTPLN